MMCVIIPVTCTFVFPKTSRAARKPEPTPENILYNFITFCAETDVCGNNKQQLATSYGFWRISARSWQTCNLESQTEGKH